MHEPSLIENNLPHIARAVIIIPIIILILGVYVKIAGIQSKTTDMAPTPTPEEVVVQPSQKKISIDLKGPYICEPSSKDSRIKAYIMDENVAVVNTTKKTTTYFTLKGDCLSIWKKGLYTGERACGMKPYIALTNNMSRFGLVGTDSLVKMLGGIGGSSNTDQLIDPQKLKAALDSCQKKDIKDIKVFDIPQNIIFKKKDVKELMQSQAKDASRKEQTVIPTSGLQESQQAPYNK